MFDVARVTEVVAGNEARLELAQARVRDRVPRLPRDEQRVAALSARTRPRRACPPRRARTRSRARRRPGARSGPSASTTIAASTLVARAPRARSRARRRGRASSRRTSRPGRASRACALPPRRRRRRRGSARAAPARTAAGAAASAFRSETPPRRRARPRRYSLFLDRHRFDHDRARRLLRRRASPSSPMRSTTSIPLVTLPTIA